MAFVLPVRKGGLGNQMFQVAAAMVYAKETNRTVLLPKEFYNKHNTQGEYAESVFREFIHRLDKPIDGYAIQTLLQNGFVQHPGEPGFEEWKPIDSSQNILLHGYFQSYSALRAHEGLIRRVYLSGLANYRKNFVDSSSRVGIHVRRGDYLQPPHNTAHPTQPVSYYEKALTYFPKDSEFYIYSDDLDWCSQQEVFQNLPNKVFIDEKNEVKALANMTTCLGGFICANSTFSWWGAFLGAYAEKKPVVVPNHWFKDDVDSLFPSEWIQI